MRFDYPRLLSTCVANTAPRIRIPLSTPTTWRHQREQGVLNCLNPKKRGRKQKPIDPSAGRIALLEKEKRCLKNRPRKAEIIIAAKKILEILGIEPGLVLGYHQAQRTGQMDRFLPVCDHGYLQQLRGRLDGCPPRTKGADQPPD